MTEHLARLIAEEFGGFAEDTGGNLWIVGFLQNDGRLVVLSEIGAGEYRSRQAWNERRAETAFIAFN